MCKGILRPKTNLYSTLAFLLSAETTHLGHQKPYYNLKHTFCLALGEVVTHFCTEKKHVVTFLTTQYDNTSVFDADYITLWTFFTHFCNTLPIKLFLSVSSVCLSSFTLSLKSEFPRVPSSTIFPSHSLHFLGHISSVSVFNYHYLLTVKQRVTLSLL